MSKKRVLSCIQPTGEIHLGNYFGAVKNWADIQDKYDCVYGVVDLHAMTMPYDPAALRENTLRMAIDLMVCGVDPEKSVIFIQSLVPEHTELTWIFNCIASFGELTRMTQFKDKTEQIESGGKNSFVSAGLFTYPILQAADILIYRADFVPVGKDQVQHLELSRNIAVRFNNLYGEYFPEPKPLLTEIQKLVSLADPTKKMSKSLGDKHYIGLFEEEESVRKKVKTAVTDTGTTPTGEKSPGVENLFNLIRACGKTNEYNSLLNDYKTGSLKYKDLKEATADALVGLTSGFRKKRDELFKDREKNEKLVRLLSEKAREYASQTIKEVKKLTGLSF
ncbi:MAG: tryptophan--tRNA ligase [Bacteroidales bacterium]